MIATTANAEVPNDPQPNTGHVEGSRYTNSFFGMSYLIPENWAIQSVGGKTPGIPNSFLLFSLKKAPRADAISRVWVSATPVSPEVLKDIPGYLTARYRTNQIVEASATINGIPTSRNKRSDDPDMLVISDRAFYRLQTSTSGTVRLVLATPEKGYVLIFEMIIPDRNAEAITQGLIDSLYGLTFKKKVTQQ